MMRSRQWWMAAVAVLLAAPALAGDYGSSSGPPAQGVKGSGEAKVGMEASAQGLTQAQASTEAHASDEAKARLAALRSRIEQGAMKADAAAMAQAEAKLDAEAKAVDADATGAGGRKVAERLAAEFETTTEAILALQSGTGASWGQILVAGTLAAGASSDVTAEQLLALRAEGTGWGRIASGLGLELGSAVSAVRAEARVARGVTPADGRVARMQGPGARVDAGANAGLGFGVGRGVKGGLGASTGLGAGVKIGK